MTKRPKCLACDRKRLRSGDARAGAVSEQIELLRAWDLRFGIESVETSLAIYWAEDLSARTRGQTPTDADRLDALAGGCYCAASRL